MEIIYFLFALLVCAFLCDLKCSKIPNALIITGIFTGILYTVFSCSLEELVNRLTITILVFAVLFPFFRLKMLGAGDVKLLMVITLFMGEDEYLKLMAVSFALALIIGLIKYVNAKRFSKRIVTVRLAVPILGGFLLCTLF